MKPNSSLCAELCVDDFSRHCVSMGQLPKDSVVRMPIPSSRWCRYINSHTHSKFTQVGQVWRVMVHMVGMWCLFASYLARESELPTILFLIGFSNALPIPVMDRSITITVASTASLIVLTGYRARVTESAAHMRRKRFPQLEVKMPQSLVPAYAYHIVGKPR